MGKGQDLYLKAKTLIPGGTQLLSKRPEMFLPEFWPSYYSKAKGCEVWDLDGKRYVDASYMGIGANVIGYADKDINKAVKKAVDFSNMNTLNAPEEVELAELMIGLHPWAGMVRYTRSGGEAMTVAVRIARAKTKKSTVLFCGYHGWHDWYLAANLADDKALDGHLLSGLDPEGAPRNLMGTSYPFNFNDKKQFLDLFDKQKENVGVIVLESIRNDIPDKDFIDTIRKKADEIGAIVIVDEITAGFRLNNGGAHLKFGIKPDIAVFAKGISNGYPMGVILGKKEIMNAAQDSFISSTYWTERIGPVAAIATIRKFIKEDVSSHLVELGKKVQDGWAKSANENSLKIEVGGIYPLGHFSFNYDKPLVYKTLFTQMMIEKGFLATTAFYLSFAHTEKHIDLYLEAVNDCFDKISKIISTGDAAEKHLKGPVCHAGFKRLN
jgi:glutamate-1-semialdehyde 2,1-aminomutase